MMNNIDFEIFIYYLLQNNSFNILNNLKLTCNTYNNIIKNDVYFIRKKNAYLLNKVISKIDINFNILLKHDDYFDHYYDYKYLLNSIFNIYTKNDITYKNYIKTFSQYKNDKLDPLKRIPHFKKIEIKERKQTSIMLNMALDHAEKQYSFNIAKEIDEYYCY